jgi:glycosyltransferase involved in cell wall biosynthesis
MKFGYEGLLGPLDYVRRYVLFVVRAAIRLGRLHRERRYDVIHVHTMPDFLVFSALVPKLLGGKVILDVHDLMPELYSSKYELPATHRTIRLISLIERLSVRFADRAIAVHRPHLDALVGHGNPAEKFTIVMNTPDPGIFRPRSTAPQPSPFTLTYHGTVGKRHGLDVAVRAVGIARKRIPDLELRVVGEGDYFPELRRLVRDLGLEDCVHLEQGFVPAEQLLPLIHSASGAVVPILCDPFTRYMLPVKLLEYMAVGVPTIASRSETIESYFGEESVLLCPPGDADALADQIIRLHSDASLRDSLSAAGMRWTADQSWDVQKQGYFDLIDSLVPSRANGRSSSTVDPRNKVKVS